MEDPANGAELGSLRSSSWEAHKREIRLREGTLGSFLITEKPSSGKNGFGHRAGYSNLLEPGKRT